VFGGLWSELRLYVWNHIYERKRSRTASDMICMVQGSTNCQWSGSIRLQIYHPPCATDTTNTFTSMPYVMEIKGWSKQIEHDVVNDASAQGRFKPSPKQLLIRICIVNCLHLLLITTWWSMHTTCVTRIHFSNVFADGSLYFREFLQYTCTWGNKQCGGRGGALAPPPMIKSCALCIFIFY
jgi:hypothetical protein